MRLRFRLSESSMACIAVLLLVCSLGLWLGLAFLPGAGREAEGRARLGGLRARSRCGAGRGASAGLLSCLFSVRTGWLAGELDAAQMTDYLSGLMIGAEFREAGDLGWFEPGQEIGIIGTEAMAELYRRAATAFGLTPRPGPADAAMRGCLAIAAMAERLEGSGS